MTEEQRRFELGKRLLRYSAVAGVVTGGALLAASPVLADPEVQDVDCDLKVRNDLDLCEIDFDDNGDPEFAVFMYGSKSGKDIYANLGVVFGYYTEGGDDFGTGLLVDNRDYSYMERLDFGDVISRRADWYDNTSSGYAAMMYFYDDGQTKSTYGNFEPGDGDPDDPERSAYVGVKFTLDDDTEHFGWIEILIDEDGDRATVKRIGYETDDRTEITAGQTPKKGLMGLCSGIFGTLGMVGASVVAAVRRRMIGV